jgi:hypothetical protein
MTTPTRSDDQHADRFAPHIAAELRRFQTHHGDGWRAAAHVANARPKPTAYPNGCGPDTRICPSDRLMDADAGAYLFPGSTRWDRDRVRAALVTVRNDVGADPAGWPDLRNTWLPGDEAKTLPGLQPAPLQLAADPNPCTVGRRDEPRGSDNSPGARARRREAAADYDAANAAYRGEELKDLMGDIGD